MNGTNDRNLIENNLGIVAGRLSKLQNTLDDLENKLNRTVLNIQYILEEVEEDEVEEVQEKEVVHQEEVVEKEKVGEREDLDSIDEINGTYNKINTKATTETSYQLLSGVKVTKVRNRMVNTVNADDSNSKDAKTRNPLRNNNYNWKTCDYWSLPRWLQDNCYILKGYRPPLSTFQACFLSIFRIHNETVNIWTHLLGCLLFIALFLHVAQGSLSFEDKLVISPFFIGAILCLGFSSSFHTLDCHSQAVSSFFGRLDYCGISLLIVGSFVPWLYYAFHCENELRILYIVVALALGMCTVILSLSQRFGQPEFRSVRATVFVALGLSGVIPALHFVVLYGWRTSITLGAPLLISSVLYITGSVIYAVRVPERIYPGKCDILFQSHQIFHVLVIVATLINCFGIFRILNVTRFSRSDPNFCLHKQNNFGMNKYSYL